MSACGGYYTHRGTKVLFVAPYYTTLEFRLHVGKSLVNCLLYLALCARIYLNTPIRWQYVDYVVVLAIRIQLQNIEISSQYCMAAWTMD